MPRFPSLEWCRAVEAEALKEPEVANAARDWGGTSVGVIIGKGDGLAKDFCIYVKPHPTELRLESLKLCEDEDDLELEEPEMLFRVSFGICKALMQKQLDPFDVLRKGQIKVVGDMKRVLTFGQKYQALGDRISPRIETTF